MIKSKYLKLSVGSNPYTLYLNIDPLTLSVAGGLGVFNGLLNNKNTKATNKTNLQIARENNEMAYRMFNEGNEFNRQMAIDMFNMENEYNDPSAVRERLENAGYNPFLSDENSSMVNFGDAATPNSVAPPALSTPTMMTPPSILNGVMDSVADITLKSAQAKKLGAETTTIDQVRDKLIKEYEINNDAKQWQLALNQAFDPMLKSLEGSEKAAYVNKLREDILLTHQNYSNAIIDGDIKTEDRELRKLEKLMKNVELKFLPDSLREQLSNLKKQGREIDSRTELNMSQKYNTDLQSKRISELLPHEIDKAAKEALSAYEEYSGKRLDNKQKSELLPILKESLKKQVRQQGSDYWNPFRYAGQLLGGSATEAVKHILNK